MKHRRIVAGLLAISVITSNVFIEGVEVSASNSGVVSEELLTESKVQMYSGMNIGANQIDTLSEIVNSGNEVDESVDDASKITESTTENPDTPEQNQILQTVIRNLVRTMQVRRILMRTSRYRQCLLILH